MNYPNNIEQDYKEFKEQSERDDPTLGYTEEELRYIWFAEDIIGFTSYDDELSYKMGKKLFETCKAIILSNQIELINNDYEYYIICLNLIGEDNLDWGSSIRFCWFNDNDKTYRITDAVKYIVKQNTLK